jgi:uncharacterized membrane protein
MLFAPFLLLSTVLLLGALFTWLIFVWIGVISNVFQAIGLPPSIAFLALLASFLGSYVNIPISEVESGGSSTPNDVVRHYGVAYRIPTRYMGARTTIALNVGGAIVPTLISLYVLSRFPEMLLASLAGVAVVTVVVNRFARPIPGLGIATPIFVPPIIAAICGWLFGAPHADAVAYVSGVLGTLIGADLLNISKVAGLGAPVASIGGAGTFDGIFLTGIVAVLLA